MGRRKQATEELLEVIRNPKTDRTPTKAKQVPKRKNKKKQIQIGIEIDGHTVRLAAVSSQEQYRLLSYQQISLPAAQDKQSLGEALIPVLRKFCAPFPQKRLWYMMASNDVEPLYYEIPHVDSPKMDSAAFWAAQKEKRIDTNTHLFDYHIVGEKTEGGIKKHRILAYTVPQKDVDEWKAFFRKIGYPLEGITISTFCLQSMLQTKWLASPAEGSVAHIFIDNESSHIEIFHKNFLVFTRDVKTGLNSLLSEIQDSFHPAPLFPTEQETNNFLTLQISPGPQNTTETITLQEARAILQAQLQGGAKLAPGQPGSELEAEQVLDFVRPVITRLLRQIQRTVSHYNNTMSLSPVEKIFITGTMSLYLPLLAYMREEFDIDIEACEPFQNAAHRSKTIRPPVDINQKMLFLPVIGLALSANPRTPNFLYTYQNKNEEKKLAKIKKGILAAGFLALFLLFGLNIAAWIDLNKKQSQLTTLTQQYTNLEHDEIAIEKQIKATDPNIELSQIEQQTEKIKALNAYLEYCAKRYAPVALFSEFFTLTPEGISIHKILYSAPGSPVSLVYKRYKNTMQSKQKTEKFTSPFGFFNIQDAQKSQPKPPASSKFILIDGIITTQEQDKDLYLSVYKMILNNSPFFEVVEVEKNPQINPGFGDSLYFTLALKVTS